MWNLELLLLVFNKQCIGFACNERVSIEVEFYDIVTDAHLVEFPNERFLVGFDLCLWKLAHL